MKEINIWDKEIPPQKYDNIILWNKNNTNNYSNITSINDVIKNKSKIIKDKYLEIIYNFRQKKVNNINLVEYFYIRKNFSYWWMSLINEKSNISKSIYINDIIKIIALELWLDDNSINVIRLHSNNKELIQTISNLCQKLNIKMIINSDKKYAKKNSYFNIKFTKLLSIVYLIYYFLINFKLVKLKNYSFNKTKKSITLISYFLNFDKTLAKKGILKSNYWTELTKLFENNNIKTNWLHLYSLNEGFSSVDEANLILKKLNKNNNENQFHFTQFTNLNLKTCIQIIKDSFKLHNLFLKFPINKFNISYKGSNTNYWPLFRSDFEKTFKYNYLIINMIYFNFFEFLSLELNQQEKIIFLQENQSWEMPFIHLFDINSKSKKIGFPHSGVRYWDLRYFDGKLSYEQSKNAKPKANFIGVNGPISKKLLINDNYPDKNIINVESLRHMHLLNNPILKINYNNKQKLNILILGDYSNKINFKMLNLLDETSTFLPKYTNYYFKPHPSNLDFHFKLKNIYLNITKEQISTLINDINVVYASDQTSSSSDAYFNGLPVIIFLNQQILNLSPLVNMPNVDFIDNNPEFLAKKIILNSNIINNVNYSDYFYLNKDMKYWNNLLMNIA